MQNKENPVGWAKLLFDDTGMAEISQLSDMKYVIPSSNQTWQRIRLQMTSMDIISAIHGKSIVNGRFSIKPCLISAW